MFKGMPPRTHAAALLQFVTIYFAFLLAFNARPCIIHPWTKAITRRPYNTKEYIMQVTKKQRTLNPNVPSTPSALAGAGLGLGSLAAQVVNATPVKAKPAKVADVSTVLYTISVKGYKPVTDKHSATEGNGTRSRTSNWNTIKNALTEKACTYAELVAKVTEAATAGNYLQFAEPASFVRKHIARGHLVAA